MSNENPIGRASGRFPSTRQSIIAALQGDEPEARRLALDRITTAYWKPVYKYIRVRWARANEDAEDLTQEFFARLIEKDFLGSYDPSRSRLRTFLRTCVDALVANETRASRRIKRGGTATRLPLDFALAEGELVRSQSQNLQDPEGFFEREWARSLFSLAVEELQRQCRARDKETHFLLFESYDLDDSGERKLSYLDLAREHGLQVTDVTNYLALARREFRRITLELLREMTASEEEFRREARALLGIEAE